jgi:hypothetical protein
MNISDIRTRIESGTDEQSFLATRSEPNEKPVLTLIDSPEPSEAEAGVKPDPLIQALVWISSRSPIPFGQLMIVPNGLRLWRWRSILSTERMKGMRPILRSKNHLA